MISWNNAGVLSVLGSLALQGTLCAILILILRRVWGRVFGGRVCRLLWLVVILRCLFPWSLPDPADTWRGALVGLWAAGAVALFAIALVRNRRLIRRAGGDPLPVPSWIQEVYLECRSRLGVRAWPVLVVSRSVDTPCLVGALRPRILLPEVLLNEPDPEQMRHILLHELMHLKQGDIWLSWLWTFTMALHWFNPLLWQAGRRLSLDCERACDEKVLGVLSDQRRRAYGHGLLSLAERLRPAPAPPPPA